MDSSRAGDTRSSSSGTYQCQDCNFNGKTEPGLRIHMTLMHGKQQEKPFRCEIPGCNVRFTMKHNLRKHMSHAHAKNQDKLKVHKCNQCDYKAYDRSSIQIHSVKHSDERPFQCDFPSCTFRAKRQQQLHQHKKRHEPDQDKLKIHYCTFCGYSSRFKQSLQSHLRTHTGDKPYACDFSGCSYRARESCKLRDHRRLHDPDSMFKCEFPGCDFSTNLKSNLRRHQERHNPARKRDFKCSLCLKAFAEKVCLTMHIRGTHTMEKRPTCKFCGKAYSCEENLRFHIAKFHAAQATGLETIVKKYKCTACAFCDRRKASVLNHQHRVHSNVKNFGCDKCNYRAKCELYLLEHQLRCHAPPQTRLFECEFCKKRFSGRSFLRKHVATVHKTDKLYECTQCEFVTKYAYSFQSHLNTQRHLRMFEQSITGGQTEGGRQVRGNGGRTKKLLIGVEQRFKCAFPECSFSTNRNSDFRNHERLHRPELKNIPCPMCPTKFYNQTALNSHVLRNHTKERPFKCDKCDYSAATSDGLRAHEEKRHTGNAGRKPLKFAKFVPADELGVKQLYCCPFCKWTCDEYMAVVRHTVIHRTAFVLLDRSCFTSQ